MSIDNWVLTDLPRNLLLKNNISLNSDTIMIGFNSMDGTVGWPWFSGEHPNTPNQLYKRLKSYISNITQVNLTYYYYYPLNQFINASVAYYTINSDVCVVCPSLLFMEQIDSKLSNITNKYVYYYRTPSYPYLAPHASELPFVFNKYYYASYFSEQWSANLSYSIMSAWTNMAKLGIPKITNNETNVYFNWKMFNLEYENVIIFDNNIRMETDFKVNYRNNVCDFWYKQVNFKDVENLCWNTNK